MGIEKSQSGKLVITAGQKLHPGCAKKIDLLNDNKFYTNTTMNKYGREYVYYLCNSSYHELINAEPINLEKNTLIKCLSRIRVIDKFVRKSIEQYTFGDINQFINAFVSGNIAPLKGPIKGYKKARIGSYIGEFKRFHKVYRQSVFAENGTLDPKDYDWIENLQSPRMSREYEYFPEVSIEEAIYFANRLYKEEYTVRALLSINLMGRKCEMSELTPLMGVRKKTDGSVWVKLPQIKKNSTAKVWVELWNFVKKPFLDYLDRTNPGPHDKIFPSREEGFAKNLKQTSQEVVKERITPKMLRKIGVYIAEQLGYDRAEIERIGGWSVNSPVLNHYFKRKRVEAKVSGNEIVDNQVNPDALATVDRLQQRCRVMEEQHSAMQKKLERFEEMERILDRKIGLVTVPL